jgi:tRNA-specific 2-thiouridylase
VLDLQPATGTVVVGPADSLDVRSIVAHAPRWCADLPSGPVRVHAQVRAHGEPCPLPLAGRCCGRGGPRRAVRGVAPGQAVVLYEGTRVLGSATITASRG